MHVLHQIEIRYPARIPQGVQQASTTGAGHGTPNPVVHHPDDGGHHNERVYHTVAAGGTCVAHHRSGVGSPDRPAGPARSRHGQSLGSVLPRPSTAVDLGTHAELHPATYVRPPISPAGAAPRAVLAVAASQRPLPSADR